jgi:uncharacterized protein
MLRIIQEQRTKLQELCRRHQVVRLELFGSAAVGDFEPAHSDLDFLVEFLPLTPGQKADAYFGLLHDLEDLFGRKVDLVSAQAVHNRWFEEAVNSQRTVLYAA